MIIPFLGFFNAFIIEKFYGRLKEEVAVSCTECRTMKFVRTVGEGQVVVDLLAEHDPALRAQFEAWGYFERCVRSKFV